jgi:hypothetical protein
MRRQTLRMVRMEYLVRFAKWLNKQSPNQPPIKTEDVSKNELVSAIHLRILLGI